MVQPVVTRSQRRVERKQVVLIVVLVLAVAGISFYLGVQFGQRNVALSGVAADIEKPKLPIVTTVVPPPPPVPEVTAEKLTFYDNLPKGNQAPLGSGINLPPEQEKPVLEVKQKDEAKSTGLPPKPLSKSASPAVAPSVGNFVVQVASFRAGDDATKLANRLKSYDLKTFVEPADLGEKGVWHRVLVGPYASRESADQAAALLRGKERLSALVRKQ